MKPQSTTAKKSGQPQQCTGPAGHFLHQTEHAPAGQHKEKTNCYVIVLWLHDNLLICLMFDYICTFCNKESRAFVPKLQMDTWAEAHMLFLKCTLVTHYSLMTEPTHTDTHLQQLAALLQSILFRCGTSSNMADKDPRSVSPDYRNIIS